MRAKQRISILLVIGAVSLIAPATSAAADCPNADTLPLEGTVTTQQLEDSLLCLLNVERVNNGLAPVTSNPKLVAAARGHSSEMRWRSYFAHESADGTLFSDRIAATGYMLRASSWIVGENIVWGSLVLGTPER